MVRKVNIKKKILPIESRKRMNTKETPTKSTTASSPKKRKRQPAMMLVGNKAFKISRKILKEISQAQSTTKNLIPRLPFSKLIHEIIMNSADFRVQAAAITALQEACEMYMTQFFEDSYLCTLHARRCTLRPPDMHLTRHIRGLSDVVNH